MIGSLHSVGRGASGAGRVDPGASGPSLAGQRHAAGVLAALAGFYKGRRRRETTATAPQSAPRDGGILPLWGLAGGCSSPDTTTSGLAVANDSAELKADPAPQPAPAEPAKPQGAAESTPTAETAHRSRRQGVGAPETASSVPLASAIENVEGTAPEPEDAEAEAEAPAAPTPSE